LVKNKPGVKNIMFEFKLSLAEANLVLAALGKQPFNDVAALIGNIKEQAEPQMDRVRQELEAEQAAAEEAANAEEAAAE
jgi:hypothetical protein